MYLKSLELSGFKSFAKKSNLEFNDRVTAIVGPNGSGKSNVAEAFRFVLGEQSIKSMRGKRTEDLIFNGAESAPRANRASVKLTFDNSQKLLNIDFDEVAIERVIHRDSLSEYFINGSQVRLRDIVELLAGAHIGASGHHIISQGEADRILNANTRERREMIEDALGLKIFQYKREESERKLEKTRENMEQVESLRKEIAPHLKFLKKQVERVEKTIALREELRDVYREYLKREKEYLETTERQIAEESTGPKRDLERLERELVAAKKVLEESKHKDAKSDELVSLEARLKTSRHERDEAARTIGRVEGETASLEKMLARERATADAEVVTVEYGKVKSLIDRVSGMLGDLANVPQIRELFKTFLAENKHTKSENRADDMEAELKTLHSRRKDAEEELQAKEKELSALSAQYAALQKEIEQSKDSSRDAEKAMFRIVAEENEIRGRLSMIQVREDKLKLERQDFEREIEEGGALIGRDVFLYESMAAEEYAALPAEERHAQEERRKRLERIKVRLEDQGGVSPDEVMKEFKETSERDEFLARELVDLERSAEALTNLIKELEDKLDTMFSQGIEKINKQFDEFFALMFGGGRASLSVVKEKRRKRGPSADEIAEMKEAGIDVGAGEEDEEQETKLGVDIHVDLPRKKIKSLEMLSGGERALTSIALLFAISQVNPPPFIILDETDAALDEANSRKYGDMVENLAKNSQLIVITHNRETMSRAGVLYGVTMGREGFSRLLSIAFNDALAVAK
ncbi:MAG: AAA family ATPase [Patescibacteria group bacterium]|nr:AAA family ATPase [Patescibacteria group bacterium]